MRWLDRVLGREDERVEVEREVRFHLEMRRREYEAAGLGPEEARVAAERSFGDVESIVEQLRAERALRGRLNRLRRSWQDVGADVRLAVRTLRRNPLFLLAVVFTLGVGVALAVAAASVVNAYLVRALPYPDAERLVFVEGAGAPDWRAAPDVFERVASWDLDALSIVSGGSPERVWASWVSPALFEMLGVRAAHGRLFEETEAGPGGASVAVISHDLWQRRWGGDAGVIGQTFTAYSDDRPDEAEVFTVVGVLAPDFWYFNRFTEILAPLRTARTVYIGSLARGVTPAAAGEALRRIAQERTPEQTDVRVVPVHEQYVQQVRPTLIAVAGAVSLVLLIAVGNAAVLLVVRAAGRDREFAVRAAIGAGRGRMGRQLLVEGAVLSALAAIIGTLLAVVLLGAIGGFVPRLLGADVPGGSAALRVDGRVLALTLSIAAASATLFGLVPLWLAGRVDLSRALADGARGMEARGRQRFRAALVTVELALSLALLAGAGLLIRSARHLQRLELGFRPDHVAVVSVSLRERDFSEATSRVAFYERAQREVEDAVRGVSAAWISWAPFSRVGGVPIETPERPAPDSGGVVAMAHVVTADYFAVMSIEVVRGQAFDDTHRAGGPRVALVSERLARQLWPGRDPIGERIRAVQPPGMHAEANEPEWSTVIGVVRDVRKTLTGENPPDVYAPLAQAPPMVAEMVVRDPSGRSRVGAVREALWRVNAEMPLNEVRWLEDDVSLATLPSRFLASLLSGFAAFAVLLASLGLYGVIAWGVDQRRRDIAIRMALGADGARVVRMFLAQAGRLAGIGVVLGLAGGLALSRLLQARLYGVSPGDPVTYVFVALVLMVAALVATWLPARRATRTEPMRVLQAE